MISAFEADVLAHTSTNERYITNDPKVLAMGDAGLLFDYGAQRLAGGDHCLVMTHQGRAALREYRAAQPPPPKPKRRRQSREFENWRAYCEAFGKVAFSIFHRDIWPNYEFR